MEIYKYPFSEDREVFGVNSERAIMNKYSFLALGICCVLSQESAAADKSGKVGYSANFKAAFDEFAAKKRAKEADQDSKQDSEAADLEMEGGEYYDDESDDVAAETGQKSSGQDSHHADLSDENMDKASIHDAEPITETESPVAEHEMPIDEYYEGGKYYDDEDVTESSNIEELDEKLAPMQNNSRWIELSQNLIKKFAIAHWKICDMNVEKIPADSKEKFSKVLNFLKSVADEDAPKSPEELEELMEKILRVGRLCHTRAILMKKSKVEKKAPTKSEKEIIKIPDDIRKAAAAAAIAASKTTKKRNLKQRLRKSVKEKMPDVRELTKKRRWRRRSNSAG